VVGDQIAIVRMRGHGHRPGMRDRHRDGAQADGASDTQPFGEQSHSGDEALPLQVRLQSGQEKKGRTEGVPQGVETELRILVVGEMVGLERHHRPAGPIVEQIVDREGRDEFGVHRTLEVIGSQPHGVPRIRETLECMDQHRPAAIGRRQLRGRELQLIHPVGTVDGSAIVSQGVPPCSNTPAV
jgi:hypothetical protein